MLDCWRGRGERNEYYICNKSNNKLLNRNFDHFTFRKRYFETSQNYTSYEQIITESGVNIQNYVFNHEFSFSFWPSCRGE